MKTQEEIKEYLPLSGPSDSSVVDMSLLANFTHQIINPLNAVVGTIDNLIDGTIPPERRSQRLKALRAQLSGTIELVRNLAFLAQLSTKSGREGLKAKSGDVSIPENIIEAAQFIQESADQFKIKISLEDKITQYIVQANKDLLRQVWLNLIENAVKYSTRETEIVIRTRVQKSTKTLLVEVQNTGLGFENSEKESLFELGFRGQSARNMRASGSGLGLYICREILALYGATIAPEHSKSKNTTIFRVRFQQYYIDQDATEAMGEKVRKKQRSTDH